MSMSAVSASASGADADSGHARVGEASRGPGEARQDGTPAALVAEAAHLAGVALHHDGPQGDLAVAGHDHQAGAARGEDGGAVPEASGGTRIWP